ncbi:hypothetical protein [Silvanigrella paludirubra]|nr:hypothetical protein [Silvanigrella paludirubra]
MKTGIFITKKVYETPCCVSISISSSIYTSSNNCNSNNINPNNNN